MKVTHVITPINYGGGENLIINLVASMNKEIVNEIVNLSYSKEFEKHLTEENVKHFRISNKDLGASPSKFEYLFFLIFNLFRVMGAKGKITGDIVHAHGFPANMFIAFMKKVGLLKGKKLIFTSHSEKKSEKSLVRSFYLWFLKEFHSITCVGEKSFESMLREFPELTDKLVKINNGIKTENFYYKEKNLELKKSLGYGSHDRLAIFISRLSHVKNHKFLIELIKKINNPHFKLLIVGEGEEKENIIKKIKEYSLEDRVKLIGFVKNEELVDYYSISDMVLFSSISEGFGIALVEALACEKPLVLFESVYFKELRNSVLVSKNEEEFLMNTRNLLENKSLGEELAKRGKTVREEFSIGNCAKNYEKLYRSLYGKAINS